MATWTKLKTGAWGITIEGTASVGQTLQVRSKSGEIKTVKIAKILWTGNGKTICAISQSGGRDSVGVGNSIRSGASYEAGVTAPHRRACPMCGSRECAKAWDSSDLCDED